MHACAYNIIAVNEDVLSCGVSDVLLPSKTCVENVVAECASELPTSVRHGLQALNMIVNFVCVEEFER